MQVQSYFTTTLAAPLSNCDYFHAHKTVMDFTFKRFLQIGLQLNDTSHVQHIITIPAARFSQHPSYSYPSANAFPRPLNFYWPSFHEPIVGYQFVQQLFWFTLWNWWFEPWTFSHCCHGTECKRLIICGNNQLQLETLVVSARYVMADTFAKDPSLPPAWKMQSRWQYTS